MKYLVLFNPYSGNHHGEEYAHELDNILKDDFEYYNMDEVKDFKKFFNEHPEDIIICGGDGTLNHFINYTKDVNYKNNILYFSTGTGNDFYNDVGDKNRYPINIGKYLENLPVVTVNGKDYHFINGCGVGLDGEVCVIGEREKITKGKKINYTNLAVKGLLYQYKTKKMKVYVDGHEYHFDYVWVATAMNGRYFAHGMKIAPNQERVDNNKLSLIIFNSKSRIKTMMAFTSIFSGKHVEKKDVVTVLTGHEIKVVCEEPVAFQMDGEVIQNVKEYYAVKK